MRPEHARGGEKTGHWAPELTALHEAEAGSRHPIDEASRALAIATLRRYGSVPRPLVLDVGCSSGFLLEALGQALPVAALVGADFIRPPLDQLAARLPAVSLVQFDLCHCPLPDASVDAVIALNVLEHIEDDALALRQIHRVLRPGGLAHIEVPAGPKLYDIYDEALLHCRRYRLSELVARSRQAGFRVLRATHLGAFLYPGFAWVKRTNRRLLPRPPEEKQRIVAAQIRRTSGSRLLRWVLRLELAAGRWMTWPTGIRCVVALRKPAGPAASS